MQQVKEVDLMNNKKLILWLNLSVIPLFFIFFFIDGKHDFFAIFLHDDLSFLFTSFYFTAGYTSSKSVNGHNRINVMTK